MAEMIKKELPKENQVYRCSWRKQGRKFVVTCESPITIVVAGDSIEQAQDTLFSEIITSTGDGDPVFQFVPDLPRSRKQQKYLIPNYHHVSANDRVEWKLETGNKPGDLWQHGICKQCKCGMGVRTDIHRIITTAPRYDIAFFYKDRNIALMFSERVLDHCLKYLEGRAKLIPVDATAAVEKKLKNKYFELSFLPEISVAIPKIQKTATKDRDKAGLSGWKCKTCGRFMIHWWDPAIGRVGYGIKRSEARSPVLLIQNGPVFEVALGRGVHGVVTSDKKIRGFVSESVAMFDSSEVFSASELKKLKLPQIRP